MDLYEYQGKQYFARYGIPMSPGGVADTVDEAVAQADAAGLSGRGQGPGEGGRPGQGRRHQAGQRRRRGAHPRRGHPGHGHPRPRGAPAVGRARLGHRPRVLRQLHPRPRRQAPPVHGVGQGRGGDRGGGRHRPRRHRPAARRPGRRAVARPAAAGLVDEAGLDPEARAAGGRAPGEPCTAATSRATATWPRSTRSSSPPTAVSTPSTPRSPWTTTPPSAIPEWEQFAGDRRPRRAGAAGQGEGPQLHRPVGLGRHHRQRRRPGHEHAGRRHPGRWLRRQLPRHRRRRQRRRHGRRPRGHQHRPGGAGHLREHLRGHHPRATRWPTASSRPWAASTSRSPIVLRLDGTNAEAGRAILAAHLSDRLVMDETMLDAARRAVALAGGEQVSIFVDENTKVIVQGLTGGQGRFHGLRNRDYGTQVVGGVTPGQGRHRRRRRPRLRHRGRGRRRHRGRRRRSWSCRPRARPAPSWRRPQGGVRFIVCITEGIPAQDEALFYNMLAARPSRRPAARPQLPRDHLPGQVQHRDHLGRHRPARRAGGHRQPLRDPHLPGAARAVPAEGGPDHLRRHRRRPGAGHELHRLPGRLRGRPRHPGRDDDRRDRRLGRGGGGRSSSRTT